MLCGQVLWVALLRWCLAQVALVRHQVQGCPAHVLVVLVWQCWWVGECWLVLDLRVLVVQVLVQPVPAEEPQSNEGC